MNSREDPDDNIPMSIDNSNESTTQTNVSRKLKFKSSYHLRKQNVGDISTEDLSNEYNLFQV